MADVRNIEGPKLFWEITFKPTLTATPNTTEAEVDAALALLREKILTVIREQRGN